MILRLLKFIFSSTKNEKNFKLSSPQPTPVIEAVHALIKAEINTHFDYYRESNEIKLQKIEDAIRRKWWWIAGVSWVVTTVLGYSYVQLIVSFYKLSDTIPEKVKAEFLEPAVNKTVDEIIQKKSEEYIDGKIKPLQALIQGASNQIKMVEADFNKKQQDITKLQVLIQEASIQIKNIETDFIAKQQDITKAQELLKQKLDIQESATAAKTGSITAYEKIIAKTKNSSELKDVATAALQEIEIFYDSQATQLFYPLWVDEVSKRNPGYSLDELLVRMTQVVAPEDQISIVNTISDLSRNLKSKQKGIVENLYDQMAITGDLRVRARLIRAISIITKEEFRPLDKIAVEAWWAIHSSDADYQSPYTGILSAHAKMKKSGSKLTTIQAISELSETIQMDPDALYSRFLKITLLFDLGEIDAGNKELDDAEKTKQNYYMFYLARAISNLKANKIEDAVNSLNTLLQHAPGMEKQIIKNPEWAPVLISPNLQRPSKKTE